MQIVKMKQHLALSFTFHVLLATGTQVSTMCVFELSRHNSLDIIQHGISKICSIAGKCQTRRLQSVCGDS